MAQDLHREGPVALEDLLALSESLPEFSTASAVAEHLVQALGAGIQQLEISAWERFPRLPRARHGIDGTAMTTLVSIRGCSEPVRSGQAGPIGRLS
jgi:hypothetical protein